MGKLQELSRGQVAKLINLEASVESYLIRLQNIPRIEVKKAVHLIDQELAWAKAQAQEITDYPMLIKVDVRTKDYVIVDLYPADEEPPQRTKLKPEYDYA